MSKFIKVRPSRSDDELRDGAAYVGYEWAVMLGARAAKHWYKGIPEDGSFLSIASHSSCSELFQLHARVLYDFLFYPAPQNDDVISIDFMNTINAKKWEDDRGNNRNALCPILTRSRDRINKMLAHLTYDRKKLKKEDGPHPDVIKEELTAAFKEFWRHMDSSRQSLFAQELQKASGENFPFTP